MSVPPRGHVAHRARTPNSQDRDGMEICRSLQTRRKHLVLVIFLAVTLAHMGADVSSGLPSLPGFLGALSGTRAPLGARHHSLRGPAMSTSMATPLAVPPVGAAHPLPRRA